jgi:hypothetical protein
MSYVIITDLELLLIRALIGKKKKVIYLILYIIYYFFFFSNDAFYKKDNLSNKAIKIVPPFIKDYLSPD